MRKLAVLAAATLILGVAAPAHAAAAEPAFESGAGWLAGQLVDDALPGFVGSDWGLTIDALLALRAGQSKPDTAGKIADAVAAHVDSYATGADWGSPEEIDGGATAKILFAAAAAGRDPLAFGGHNMRQRLLDLVDTNGWVMDSSAGALVNGGNAFDQSLAVLGLSRSGGVPAPVLDFLVKQQCADGGFRMSLSEDASPCVSHVDGTALAVQALYAAGSTTAADKGATWLISVQSPTDGGFNDGWSPAGNSNSTGLAGQALYAAGKTEASEKAAEFIRQRQLTPANAGAAAAQVGAVAWTKDSLDAAAANGIADFELDQWRRATSQALLALAKVPMGKIGIEGPPATTPPPSSSSPPPPGGNLPVTGNSVTGLAVTGTAVVLAGFVLVLVARRRRESGK